eukprot:12327967-Ditylum_brightwellii.AAC.1
MSKIHALKITLCTRVGYSLRQWTCGLQVMLQKIKGNFSVEKLQAILLIEVDYNWLTKELIGKRLIARGTETKMIQGDNFDGIKDTSCV